jgi:hypothetical protein
MKQPGLGVQTGAALQHLGFAPLPSWSLGLHEASSPQNGGRKTERSIVWAYFFHVLATGRRPHGHGSRFPRHWRSRSERETAHRHDGRGGGL